MLSKSIKYFAKTFLNSLMGLRNNLSDLLRLGKIKDSLVRFIEAKFELKKIEIQEKAEKGIAELIFTLGLVILGAIVLVFILILAAYGLNSWLGTPLGYIIILVILLATFIGVYVNKGTIKDKIRDTIQKEMDAMDS
ncbi:MAG: putative membrane protein YqjE [Arcticibacterium sp.]|jgi:uncharacterized membrane protein YqjE